MATLCNSILHESLVNVQQEAGEHAGVSPSSAPQLHIKRRLLWIRGQAGFKSGESK